MEMNDFFTKTFLENELINIALFFGIILLGIIFKKYISVLLSKLLFKVLKKYSSGVGVEQFIGLLTKPLGIFITLIYLYLAFMQLQFPPSWNLVDSDKIGLKMITEKSYMIALTLSFTWIFLRIVDFLGVVMVNRAALTEGKSDDQLVPFIRDGIKVFVVIFSFFFVLGAVFSLNITSLVAGLGIGGLAIALAAKESLENLFGSFTIFLDKPFVVGDLVQAGPVIGNVESIGFRSTRLRTLDKSYVTVPNKKMIDVELDNLSLRTFRRARFNVGLTYSTSASQIKAIVKDINDFIQGHPNTNQDGVVHFYEFGASSLDIMVQYFVDTMDWDVYLKIREEINYKIIEIVESHDSSFAFPTQTIHLEKTN